jgi:hypothetical protein
MAVADSSLQALVGEAGAVRMAPCASALSGRGNHVNGLKKGKPRRDARNEATRDELCAKAARGSRGAANPWLARDPRRARHQPAYG